MVYNSNIVETNIYTDWFTHLRDVQAKATDQGNEVFILLGGGDKSTQSKDIKTALQLARKLKETI